jgi:hypothetical protein
MDSNAYQVPLLLYAPGVLEKTTFIDYVTSHIDLQPSILNLLGLADSRYAEQGSPLWDKRIANRKTFFWGNLYTGIDGFYSAGRYYSWLRDIDVMRVNDILLFGPEQALDQSGIEARQAKKYLQAMDYIRSAWFNGFRSATEETMVIEGGQSRSDR